MKQYECLTPAEVRDTWYRISNTRSTARTKQERKEEHDWWYGVCQKIRKAARKGIRNYDSWDDWTMHDENDIEHDVQLNIGYDTENGVFLVWMEE